MEREEVFITRKVVKQKLGDKETSFVEKLLYEARKNIMLLFLIINN